jgi:hypothetical protein
VELSREYDEEIKEKLDDRLIKFAKKLAKIAPVNMAKTIENALSWCMEKMIDQLTDRLVKRLEDAAEQDRKKAEIRMGKQVEATPEEDMSGWGLSRERLSRGRKKKWLRDRSRQRWRWISMSWNSPSMLRLFRLEEWSKSFHVWRWDR